MEEDPRFDIAAFLRKIKLVWSCKAGSEFGVVNPHGEDERRTDRVNLALALPTPPPLHPPWKRYAQVGTI